MANNGRGYVPLHWYDQEHRSLPYTNSLFNDPASEAAWNVCGYKGVRFTGDMYDMKNKCPSWFDISVYERFFGWEQLSWSFYRMSTMTILPEHVDTFKRYKELHKGYNPDTIFRAIVFLEDWQPGHVLTLGNEQVDQWVAGSVVWWKHNVPHLAANIGIADRYTLQLTGFNIK